MERPAAPGLQIRSKHSSCKSQYLHTVKKAITEHYKLDIDDPAVCRGRAEYLLEEDRFTCPPRNYRVAFQHCPCFFRTVVRLNPSNSVDSKFLLDS